MIKFSPLRRFMAALFCMTLSACSGGILKKQTTDITKSPRASLARLAPVIQYGASDGYGSAGVHTVLAGETLKTIAGYYQLAPRDIADANHLSAPYTLSRGMRLVLPPPETYRVRRGDTIALIARTFDITPDALIATNGPKIQTGQNIRLPRFATAGTNPREDLSSNWSTDDMAAPIASTIQSSNVVAAPTTSVQVASLGPVQMTSSTSSPGAAVVRPLQKPDFLSHTNGSPDLARVGRKPTVPTKETAWTIDPGPVGAGGFSRPVQGPIVSAYGPKKGGLYNEGINIAAPTGTPVRAAQTGKIVYVGNAVEGYGNLVLIKHEGGIITAYAHMGRTLVQDGQIVRQGQVIGTVGTTGNVSRAQLHFEIRKGRDSINPADMI